jgi:N-hydroxyarylamine O-acetyltransferase
MLDLDAYFGRIGWTGSRAPTLDVLSGLCLRHTASVPFENLEILLGRPIELDLASLQEKLVARRRGGYCFEQNALFQAVLVALGFRVTPLSGRVRLGVAPEVPRTTTRRPIPTRSSPRRRS